MKLIKFILILLSLNIYAQSDVPEKYWVNDANFNKAINGDGFEEKDIVVVEFWAEFNKENCFAEWAKLDVPYYRVNIADAPEAKKRYRVRMAPTIIIFKEGSKERVFKAGLDLLLPTDLQEIKKSIEEVRKEASF
jgi:thioredoxin-like negative regulator of GroEL